MAKAMVYMTVPNAHMILTRLSVDRQRRTLKVSFADGLEGEVSLEDIESSGQSQALDLSRISLPNTHHVEIGVLNSGHIEEVPWDFFRMHLDEEFRRHHIQGEEQSRKKLGLRIKRMRALSEPPLTQEELATKASISRVTLADIERGSVRHPRLETLRKIAKGLAVEVSQLLS